MSSSEIAGLENDVKEYRVQVRFQSLYFTVHAPC